MPIAQRVHILLQEADDAHGLQCRQLLVLSFPLKSVGFSRLCFEVTQRGLDT